MPKKSYASKMMLFAVSVLLLGTLACALDFGNGGGDTDLSVQQTLVALQMTQAALEDQEADPPPDPPTIPEDPQPEEPQTEALTEEPPDIVFEGVAFSFDQSLVQNVTPTTIQRQDLGEESMPSETYPTHIEIILNCYAVSEHFHTPKVLIYPVEEYRAMSPYAADIFDTLKQTLISKPGGGSLSYLPFLPMWNAAQLFSARVDYFDFQNGSGVRYLTMYGQALWPADNQNLFYTYQGMTDDNQYYICAIMPITHLGLPNEGQVDDWMAFETNWDSYISDTLNWLEAQDPNSFFPSLNTLDALIASFEIKR